MTAAFAGASLAAVLPAAWPGQSAISGQEAGSTSNGQSSSGPDDPSAPLARGRKLYLKDGDFQLVREYRMEGNRVRYYSVERSQWEEIPADMVDWDATKRAEATETQQDAALLSKIHSEEAARKAVVVDVDRSRSGVKLSLHVAPSDMGRIIGKRGRVAQALRTVVRAAEEQGVFSMFRIGIGGAVKGAVGLQGGGPSGVGNEAGDALGAVCQI